MNLIPCKSVEFLTDKRGPGPRNQSDSTATYATHKAKVGQGQGERVLVPTGLVILHDRAAATIYLIKPDAVEDACVAYPWSEVRRAIPESHEWLQAEFARQSKGK